VVLQPLFVCDRAHEWLVISYGCDGGSCQRNLEWAIALSVILYAWLDSQVKVSDFQRYQRESRGTFSKVDLHSCTLQLVSVTSPIPPHPRPAPYDAIPTPLFNSHHHGKCLVRNTANVAHIFLMVVSCLLDKANGSRTASTHSAVDAVVDKSTVASDTALLHSWCVFDSVQSEV
jgi:hypothetical protein